MAIQISNNLNLQKNQLLNPAFQLLASNPGTPVAGQFYMNTGSDRILYRNAANTTWLELLGTADFTFDINTLINSGLAGGDTIDINNTSVALNIDASNLTSEATVDPAADTLMFYDTSVGATRKTTIQNIISGAINDTSIYTDDGTLTSSRTVTQGSNSLTFTGSLVGITSSFVNTNTGTGRALSATSSGDVTAVLLSTKTGATVRTLDVTATGGTATGIKSITSGSGSLPLLLEHGTTVNTVVTASESFYNKTTPANNNGVKHVTTALTSTGVKKTWGEQEFLFTNVTNNSEATSFNLKLLHNNSVWTRLTLTSAGLLGLTTYGQGVHTGTAAKWLAVTTGGAVIEQDAPTGTIENAYGSMTDGTITSTAVGDDTFKFRSANNLLSLAVQNNDPTHGDNLLLTVNEANINHDNLAGFVGNEHIDHSAVSIIAGVGLDGGGNITASRTIDLDIPSLPSLSATPATDDTFAVYDQNVGAHRKVTYGELIDGVIGGVEYISTWNANTNTPTLESSTGTKGHYYVVSTAGSTNIDGITDWKVSDWIIFNGTTWEKVDNTDQVSSVFGRQGAVVAQAGDYDADQIDVDNAQFSILTGTDAQTVFEEIDGLLDTHDTAITNIQNTMVQKYVSDTVTFTANTTQTITHNLGTQNVQVGVRNTATNELVFVDAVANGVNTVQIHTGATTFSGVVTVFA